MEKTVRIGSDSRRSQSNQRTNRRRPALERNLVEEVAINIGMKRRIILQQITCGFYRHGLCRALYLQCNIEVHGDDGSNINILSVGIKPLSGDSDVIGVERDV